MAALAAGYGVLFTIVADFRDEYGISETAIGFVIGLGFIAGFLSQIVLAPLADRGHVSTETCCNQPTRRGASRPVLSCWGVGKASQF